MAHDYDGLLWAETSDLAATLHELSDADFDHSSLCEGWRVRDVASHMIVGHTFGLLSILGEVAKHRGNVPKASLHGSIAYGSSHSPAEIRAAFDDLAANRVRRGISKVIKTSEGFADHLIHHQDIRRPLGRPRAIPTERLVAALDVVPSSAGSGAKKRMPGLRWVATDVDWAWGSGPEVRGPAEALILAASGRAVVLDELAGDGVARLKTA
jgi:uncharacterized protein (TIGR03083 family)